MYLFKSSADTLFEISLSILLKCTDEYLANNPHRNQVGNSFPYQHILSAYNDLTALSSMDQTGLYLPCHFCIQNHICEESSSSLSLVKYQIPVMTIMSIRPIMVYVRLLYFIESQPIPLMLLSIHSTTIPILSKFHKIGRDSFHF